MADKNTATTEAPKRKRAAFTRTEKPFYAVVSATDANGTSIPLTREGLNIRLTKDTDELVSLMTEGLAAGSVLVKVEAPKAPAKPAAPEAAPATA